MTQILAPLLSERLLIDHLPHVQAQRAMVVSPGRAQLAEHWISTGKISEVFAWYIDLYAAAMAAQSSPEQLNIICAADLPEGPFDLIALPVMKNSESELTCDLMQQAHQRLIPGGTLAMAVDHPADHWVHDQMRKIFSKVTAHRTEKGCVYWAKKTNELKKIRDYRAEFALRDEDQLIQMVSRPGVFAHRRVDAGARQLLNSAEVGPTDHVLDMGCGVGTVAIAIAKRTSGLVHAVDSNARAIECLQRNCERNQLSNVRTYLNADGQLDLPRPVDLALANPPYFGDGVIAQHFVDTCIRLLREGGALLVVTKKPRWYHAYFESRLEDIAIFESSNYFVCCGRKP
jgi:16S rRNA (guanine1207-N2)-methyltransferase